MALALQYWWSNIVGFFFLWQNDIVDNQKNSFGNAILACVGGVALTRIYQIFCIADLWLFYYFFLSQILDFMSF